MDTIKQLSFVNLVEYLSVITENGFINKMARFAHNVLPFFGLSHLCFFGNYLPGKKRCLVLSIDRIKLEKTGNHGEERRTVIRQ